MKNKKNLAKMLLTCSLLVGCGADSQDTTSSDSVKDVTNQAKTQKSADHKCGGSSCGAKDKKSADHKCGGSSCGAKAKKSADHKCGGSSCGAKAKKSADHKCGAGHK